MQSLDTYRERRGRLQLTSQEASSKGPKTISRRSGQLVWSIRTRLALARFSDPTQDAGVLDHRICTLISFLPLLAACASTGLGARATPAAADTRPDGQHDFDFEIGTWKTSLERLQHPLSGSTTWVEYEGTTIVRAVWDGRANLVELVVDGPAGHIEGLSLRLYDPGARKWSL